MICIHYTSIKIYFLKSELQRERKESMWLRYCVQQSQGMQERVVCV